MLIRLANLGSTAWYWLALVVMGFSMEVVALSYQYVLDYLPCVLCIHTRLWVLAFTLLALLTLIVPRARPVLIAAHLLNTAIMIALLERSWMLLGTERGLISGSCDMDSGLPDWFALDVWFPTLFKVWEPCGYTPELLFGITMAEALLVFSAVLVVVSAALTLAILFGKNLKRP